MKTCPGFKKEEWCITREKLKQTLGWGFGITAQAFDKLWDATPTPRTRALPDPPAAAGARPDSPTGSSDTDEVLPMPRGLLLNMPDPLGALASHPSVRADTSILLLCPEPALVEGEADRLRVPAIHIATGAPAFLVAPATVPSAALLFRDVPEFAPIPIASVEDMSAWPNCTMMGVEAAYTWHSS